MEAALPSVPDTGEHGKAHDGSGAVSREGGIEGFGNENVAVDEQTRLKATRGRTKIPRPGFSSYCFIWKFAISFRIKYIVRFYLT